MQWNGKKWQGFDVPDFPPTSAPEDKVGPFIMLPDGLGHLFALNKLADGPFRNITNQWKARLALTHCTRM
jgi:formate dehydrogenase-N alpha subunit